MKNTTIINGVEIITISQKVDAGSKVTENSKGEKKKVQWPASVLVMESVENIFPDAPEMLVRLSDRQLIAHPAATMFKNNGGDLSKFPQELTAGKQFYVESDVIRLNPAYVPSTKGAAFDAAGIGETLLTRAKVLTVAGMPTSLRSLLSESKYSKKQREAILAAVQENN